MGSTSARYLAAICATSLSGTAQAQSLPNVDLSGVDPLTALTYCAYRNLEPLVASVDEPEAVAIAALASCKSEKARVMASTQRVIGQWEYHRRSLLDDMISLIVRNRVARSSTPAGSTKK